MMRFNPERLMPQANVGMVVHPEGTYVRWEDAEAVITMHATASEAKSRLVEKALEEAQQKVREQALQYMADQGQDAIRQGNLLQHLIRLLLKYENHSPEEAEAVALLMMDNPPE